MKSTTATVRIRIDQAIEVEKRKMNLSEFVRKKLDQEFGSNDFIKAKEKELKEQLQNLKSIKKAITEKSKEISQKEKRFFLETKQFKRLDPKSLLPNEKEFWEDRLDTYNRIFKKNISMIEFNEMITL